MTAKRKRIEALEAQRRDWEAAHPPAAQRLGITLEEMQGKTAAELTELYRQKGGKFAPVGAMPGPDEMTHPDTVAAMTAPQLVRLYFQWGQP